jgi:hypothetical protein
MRRLSILLALSLLFSGCTIIGGLFKAGLVMGIITVLLIVAVIAFIARMFKK